MLLLLAVFCAVLTMQSCEEGCENGTSITDCESIDPTETEVQVLLNGGKTPLELVNDGIPLNSLYGKMYEGGFIFYLNTNDGSGMVAATEDQNDLSLTRF